MVVAHICSPAFRRLRQENHKFKASLATERDPVSKRERDIQGGRRVVY
jgi:hypothetical protein